MGLTQSASFGEDNNTEEEDDKLKEKLKQHVVQKETLNELPDSKESSKAKQLDELEQDPEIVPFESSASPASFVTTPHLGPSIKVWDPGHMLSPLSLLQQGRSFSMQTRIPPGALVGDEICTKIYVIRHAESSMNLHPELISGRSPSATITPEVKRQARALGVFLLSHGVHFDAVFSSPPEYCKQTAVSVCQEVNFRKEKIEFADALMERSQGLWEGLHRSEIDTPEVVNLRANIQSDFHAPGGESPRQVEFRMMEFLNNVVLQKAIEASLHKDVKSSLKQGNGSFYPKANGESWLHIASKDMKTVAADEIRRQREFNQKAPSRPRTFTVAIFSHAVAIKCLLQGILGSDPRVTQRFQIVNTSATVMRHSTHQGWQIQRVNDTAHLRLL